MTFSKNGFHFELSTCQSCWSWKTQPYRKNVKSAYRLMGLSGVFLVEHIIHGVGPVLSSPMSVTPFTEFNSGQVNFMVTSLSATLVSSLI